MVKITTSFVRFILLSILSASLFLSPLVKVLPVRAASAVSDSEEDESRVQAIMRSLSLEQKIAQMIIPGIRTWDGKNVTDLSEVPALAEALSRHPYGGIILFRSNMVSTEQSLTLINDLQKNNSESLHTGNGSIPYLMATDQEGGLIFRLIMGTRGTGSMALGACAEAAEKNTYETGQVFGRELAALGINVNLGPCIDVITDLTDSGMSSRVFSDDPEQVARLAAAFERGVGESNVITTYKHFPGAGDGSDLPTAVSISAEDLKEQGLYTFQTAIRQGAEMVMAAATTFPLIDEPRLMADGTSKGFYPATLSKHLITEILREKLGFEGVVMTDALEMLQFDTEPETGKKFFDGELGTVEHDLAVAENAILAGCDLLLLPKDIGSEEDARYFEDYIQGLAGLVEDGSIPQERIDLSVERILRMKERHGILDLHFDCSDGELEEKIRQAEQIVGCPDHRSLEFQWAKDAVTLLKNDGSIPLSLQKSQLMIVCPNERDHDAIRYALEQLQKEGFLPGELFIKDRILGENDGSPDKASLTVIIDTHADLASGDDADQAAKKEAGSKAEILREDVNASEAVICISKMGSTLEEIQDTNANVKNTGTVLLILPPVH